MMTEFKGIYPALMTPFDAGGNVDRAALRRLVRMNMKKGVNGFYVCGSTAEVFLLTGAQRMEILETVMAEVNHALPVIAHVGCISQAQAEELARHAARLGVDAVSSVPPFYYPFTAEEIRRYYLTLADAAKRPVLIYNIPGYSGVRLTVEDLRPLLEDGRFLGVKHTSSDFFMLERMRRIRSDLVVMNGLDEMFLAGLSMGADGGIGSTYNFMAEKFVAMYRLFQAGRMREALKIQGQVNAVVETLLSLGLMAAEKEALCLMGICSSACMRPFGGLSDGQRSILKKALSDNECLCD